MLEEWAIIARDASSLLFFKFLNFLYKLLQFLQYFFSFCITDDILFDNLLDWFVPILFFNFKMTELFNLAHESQGFTDEYQQYRDLLSFAWGLNLENMR